MNLPMSLEAHTSPLASPIDPLALLRQGTRAAHDAIEALPAMRRLLDPDYSKDEYRRLLLSLWPLLHALEADLLPGGAQDRIRITVSRADALRRDLQALGDPLAELPPIAIPHTFPLASESQRAGVLYVLEGSALGGQLIRRALMRRFGTEASDWCHYFDIHAGDAGRQWRRYVKALREHPGLDADTLVAAAQLTFQRFAAQLGALSDSDAAPALGSTQGAISACPFARAQRFAAGFANLCTWLRTGWWA